MSLIVKGEEPKTIELADGLHTGRIKYVEERQVEGKDYAYLDVFIDVDNVVTENGKPLELKVGYPLPKKDKGVNEKQALGKLIKRFTKQEIQVDKEYNLQEILEGKKVQFITIQDDYVQINKDSLKPLPENLAPEEQPGIPTKEIKLD